MMIKKGASGKALVLMILNITLDVIFGSLPVVGDIFDLFFKANKRNLNLYQDHFEDGEHTGSAWPIILGVLVLLIFLFTVVVWLAIKFLGVLWELIVS